MIGFWQKFPFWQTFMLCAIGGIFGVMFTIPLRRALVVESDLPYPEGRAAAETLKVGNAHRDENGQVEKSHDFGSPLRDISIGTLLAFVFGLFSSGFGFLGEQVSRYGKIVSFFTGTGFQFSFALIGAGYLIGGQVAIALLVGSIISWLIAVPILAYHVPHGLQEAGDFALMIWSTKVRFIGAGTIGIAAVVAIISLLKPVYSGFKSSIQTMFDRADGQEIPLHERDIPIVWVLVVCLLLVLPLLALFGDFASYSDSTLNAGLIISLVVSCVFLVVLIGFIVAAVSGYMAGLVGSSNSPISGIGIIATIAVSLFLSYVFSDKHAHSIGLSNHFLIALALFVTSAIICAASISNDNLQDLKTGHLVGATPWKQQISLVIGVVIGAMVIAPVLNQLYQAYGFVGALPRAGMDPANALNAPQATLMMAIAKGVLSHSLDWSMIGIGILIGFFFILANKFLLDAKKWALSVLSIGIGIYLPAEITLPLILGGFLSYYVKRRTTEGASKFFVERCATLLSSGFIVGSSLFGILLAVLIGFSGKASPLVLVSHHFAGTANILGTIVFILICIYFVRYILRTQKAFNNKTK